jgi:hypothetical protein
MKQVPDRDEPIIGPDGKIRQAWLEFLQDLQARAFREPVAKTTPSNGQTMKYVSSTGLWTPST